MTTEDHSADELTPDLLCPVCGETVEVGDALDEHNWIEPEYAAEPCEDCADLDEDGDSW